MADEHSDFFTVDITGLHWGTTYQVQTQAVGDQYEYVDSLWSDVYEFETVAFVKPPHSYAFYPNGYYGELPPLSIKTTKQTAYAVEVVTDYYVGQPAIEVTIGLSKSTLRAWTQDVHAIKVDTGYIMMGGLTWR